MLEVTLAYAVSDPSAMVVHASDTSTTFAAVMCAWRFHTLALKANVLELVRQIVDVVGRKGKAASRATSKNILVMLIVGEIIRLARLGFVVCKFKHVVR